MAEIKAQKPKRELSADEKAIYDKIEAGKKELRALREKKKAVNMQRRKDEVTVVWVVLKYIRAQLQTGSSTIANLMSQISASLKPNETYADERVKADQEAIARFVQVNKK